MRRCGGGSDAGAGRATDDMEHELTERIIECVRKHRCLYDPGDVHFKNATVKKRTWISIASKLNEQCHTIKTKWKTVRDGYIKYKKQSRASGGAHYIWAEHLAFLDGSVRLRAASGAAGSERGRRNSCSPPSSPAPDRTTTKYEHSLPLEVELASPPGEPGLDRMMYEYLTARRPERETCDGVDHLFLSYAQTFKSLSQRTQATLKVTLAKLFSEAELGELPRQEPARPAQTAHSSSQT